MDVIWASQFTIGRAGKEAVQSTRTQMAVSTRPMIVMLLICGLLHGAAATVYNVGGDAGWTLQSANSTFYDDQFKDITLFAGDTLNFSFAIGAHDLVMVPEANLATCDNSTGAILYSNTAIEISPVDAGTWGFLCDFPQHCSQFGMHLKATFVSTAAPSPVAGNEPPPPAVPGDVRAVDTPDDNKAVLVRSDPAMLMAAVLVAACGVLLL